MPERRRAAPRPYTAAWQLLWAVSLNSAGRRSARGSERKCALCCPEVGRSRCGAGSQMVVVVSSAWRWAVWPASGAWAGWFSVRAELHRRASAVMGLRLPDRSTSDLYC